MPCVSSDADKWSPVAMLQDGFTALMFAVMNNQTEIVKNQLQHKNIDVNVTNNVTTGMCVGYAWPHQGRMCDMQDW